MPMLSDRGWDGVCVEGGGDMHSGQMREWGGGARERIFPFGSASRVRSGAG